MKNGARALPGTAPSSTLALAVSFAFSGAAFAQQDGAQMEEVVVTGSRIQRNSMTTSTPVTSVSAEQMRDMAPGNMIDAFDQLPQFLSNTSPTTQSNFTSAAGASNLNMRGIGTNRTLILLDGRRVVAANRQGTVDINLFPEQMIERTEVVTGGASAAYGTDAVAGVANFILDTDYEGLDSHAQFGETSRGDAQNSEYGLTFGTPIGRRSHLIASVEHYQRDGVAAYPDRDWYQGWGLVTSPDWDPNDPSSGPQRLIAPQVVSTGYTYGGLINQPGSELHRLTFQPNGTTTPFVESDLSAVGTGTQSQSVVNGGSGVNLEGDTGGQGGMIPDSERDGAFAYFEHELSDNVTLYAQGIYGESNTSANGNSPVLFSLWEGTVFAENPFLPQNVRDVMQAEDLDSFGFARMHSPADLGRGRLDNTNTTTSYTAGFDAQIDGGAFDGWLVNGYFQYGKNENRMRLIDFLRTDRISIAMDAVRDPDSGEIRCYAELVGNPRYEDCVPLNLLGEGAPSPEAIDYVLGPDKHVRADVVQRFAEVTASGEVAEGWGAGPLSAAFGISWREDWIEQRVGNAGSEDLMALETPVNDPSAGIRGMPLGFAGDDNVFQFSTVNPWQGSYDVTEYFGELLIPVVNGAAWAESLEMNVAARWADYSGSGGIWAYKAGVDWQIVPSVRFRGTYSRDVRAANFSERFDQQGQGSSADDPVFDGENYSFSQIYGGNPTVEPEKADTYTFGLVYQPSFAPAFSIAADYYNIELSDAIDLLGTQRIIDDCYAGAEDLCGQITRDPDTNRIRLVENVFMNLNKMNVSGLDLEATYSPTDNMNFRFLASRLDENSITNVGAPKVDQAGEVGNGSFPEWRWTLSMNYRNGPFSMYAQQRYISEGTLDAEWVEGVDVIDNTVDSAMYTDVKLTYEVETGGTGLLEVYGNITNLFDEEPPIAADFFSFSGAQQTNESLHDVLGRRYTAGLRYSF